MRDPAKSWGLTANSCASPAKGLDPTAVLQARLHQEAEELVMEN